MRVQMKNNIDINLFLRGARSHLSAHITVALFLPLLRHRGNAQGAVTTTKDSLDTEVMKPVHGGQNELCFPGTRVPKLSTVWKTEEPSESMISPEEHSGNTGSIISYSLWSVFISLLLLSCLWRIKAFHPNAKEASFWTIILLWIWAIGSHFCSAVP